MDLGPKKIQLVGKSNRVWSANKDKQDDDKSESQSRVVQAVQDEQMERLKRENEELRKKLEIKNNSANTSI